MILLVIRPSVWALNEGAAPAEMAALMVQEIPIDLVFERTGDGRYRVTSEDVPGFYMAGSDIDRIQNDLNEVVADLLRLNCGFLVSDIRWFPTLSDVKKHLEKPPPEGKIRYIASGTLAA